MSNGRSDMPDALPSFERPPVNETAIGVEFARLPGFGLPYFGLYWNAIRQDYPTFETYGPIASQPERFGAARFLVKKPRVELLTEPEVRCWFIHASGDRLLQLQADRFIHNWRKQAAGGQYPRYETLRPCFEAEWRRFLAFLAANGLPEPTVTQCDVTYVNHLEVGHGWKSMADVGRVFPFINSGKGFPFIGAPETATLNMHFVIPPEQGRLRASVQHARRVADGTELLQFTLAARGAPKSSSWEDIAEWFDLGREWVVRGFADLTSPEMHQVWGRRS